MNEPDYDAPGARLALMKDRYLQVMGRDPNVDFDAADARFTLRLWDGMDGCWCDCVEGGAHEVLAAWHQRTKDGTEKVSFNEIDYFRIFPQDSRMHWDGREGREMCRPQDRPAGVRRDHETGPLATASMQLRHRTGVSKADCDAAIIEAEGDVDAALEIVLRKGFVRAASASPTAGFMAVQGLWGVWMRLEHWAAVDGGPDLVGSREQMVAKAAEFSKEDTLPPGVWYEARPYDGNDPASSPTLLRLPDGRMVAQGGPEDRATWWTCQQCHFTGPAVGSNERGEHVCMGILCGGKTMNPAVPRLPETGP